MPEEIAKQTNPDGSLKLWAGNIAVHVFDVDFLDRCSQSADALPFHRALKAVAHVDHLGNLHEPKAPNAIKLERFVFDLLPAAEKALVVEALASESFAPVKNAIGSATDTPQSCQKAIVDLHRKWLTDAGARVDENCVVNSSCVGLGSARCQATNQPSSVDPLRHVFYLEDLEEHL